MWLPNVVKVVYCDIKSIYYCVNIVSALLKHQDQAVISSIFYAWHIICNEYNTCNVKQKYYGKENIDS